MYASISMSTASMSPSSSRSIIRQRWPCMREPLVAGLLGQREQVVGRRQALLHVLRSPQRPVARHQREAEPAGVVGLAGDVDGLAAQLGAALELLGEAQLHRQPGEQARPQRRVGLADRRQRLLDQPHDRLVDDAAGHLARLPVAERGERQQRRRAERARRVGGLAERAAGGDRVAGLGLGVAAREQQLAAALPVGAGLLERVQGDLVQPRRLLVGELLLGLLGGALGVVDGLRRRRGSAAPGRSGARARPAAARARRPPGARAPRRSRRCRRPRRIAVSPS